MSSPLPVVNGPTEEIPVTSAPPTRSRSRRHGTLEFGGLSHRVLSHDGGRDVVDHCGMDNLLHKWFRPFTVGRVYDDGTFSFVSKTQVSDRAKAHSPNAM